MASRPIREVMAIDKLKLEVTEDPMKMTMEQFNHSLVEWYRKRSVINNGGEVGSAWMLPLRHAVH